jgi:hypothetical protein
LESTYLCFMIQSPLANYFLERGWSWTTSNILPYIVLFLAGFFIYLLLLRFVKKKLWRWIAVFLLLLVPSGVYFGLYPIYEFDFVDASKEIVWPKDLTHVDEKGLVIVVIPGCPFCAEAMETANQLLERNPKLSIDVVVLAKSVEDLKAYRSKVDGRIAVIAATNEQTYVRMSHGRFPFYLQRNGSRGYLWTHEQVGPMVLDRMEQ